MTTWRTAVRLLPKNGVSVTELRFSEESYTNEALTPAFVEPRLTRWVMRQAMFGPARTRGPLEIGGGTIELMNQDGALDYLNGGVWLFDGQPFEVYRYDAASPATVQTLMQGVCEQPIFSATAVTVPIRDYVQLFEKPFLTARYGGTNALPNGLDGVADDIKGQVKPYLFGKVLNATPILVNTSRLIYQIHEASPRIGTFLAVFDRRVQLTLTGANRSIAQFNAGSSTAVVTASTVTNKLTTALPHGLTAPPFPLTAGAGSAYYGAGPEGVSFTTTGTLPAPLAAGTLYYARVTSGTDFTLHPTAADAAAGTNTIVLTTVGTGVQTVVINLTLPGMCDWCYDASGSYLRLGSTPVGRVTFDADIVGAAPQPDIDLGLSTALFKMLGTGAFTINTGYTGDAIGFYLASETPCLDVLRAVLDTAGLSLSLRALGIYADPPTFFVTPLASGAPSALMVLDQSNIQALEYVPRADPERDAAVSKVTVNYRKNYTVMSPADVGGVGLVTVALVGQPWRKTDPLVFATYANAPEIVLDTLYTEITAPTARRSAIATNTTRRLFRATVTDFDGFFTFLLTNQGVFGAGVGVTVTYPRYGLDAGVTAYVIGYDIDLVARTVALTIST